MHLPSLTYKKISPLLIVLFIALVVFGMGMPHAAQAADEGNWWNLLNPISWVGWAAQLLAYITLAILIVILFIESYIIDNLFIFNIVLNPTNMPAVIGAWKVLRDIANSLFLLILLWLAIKIIWGFDDGSSKKLLVRLIIVAFLINFSLVITGAIFGFGNALAKPFKDKMGDNVVGYIISKTKLNTVTNTPANPEKVPKQNECLLSALTDPKSQIKVECPEKSYATDTMNMISGAGSAVSNITLNNTQIKRALELNIANIFLFLIILTFGCVGGFLIVRIAMMAFLGVLSPAAFFLYAVPGGENLYKRWQKNLIGWAFIAPTFYFLFYVSLLILTKMTESPLTNVGDKIPFAANIFAMMPLVIFLVFLGATLSICKKLGAEVADAAIGMGKAAAGLALTAVAGVATGGLSLAGGAIARGAAGTATSVVGKLADKPIIGKLASPLTNPIRNYYQNRNQDITKMKGDYQNTSTRDLVGNFRTTLSSDKRIAMAETLHQRGDFDQLKPDEQKKVLGFSSRFGRTELLTARPDLVTQKDVLGANSAQDAQKKTLDKMTPDQKSKISKNAYAGDDMKKLFLETANTEDIKMMVKRNADMTKDIIHKYFDANQDALRNTMKPETFRHVIAQMRIQTGKKKNADQQNSSTDTNTDNSSSTPPSTPPPPGP